MINEIVSVEKPRAKMFWTALHWRNKHFKEWAWLLSVSLHIFFVWWIILILLISKFLALFHMACISFFFYFICRHYIFIRRILSENRKHVANFFSSIICIDLYYMIIKIRWFELKAELTWTEIKARINKPIIDKDKGICF